MSYTHSFQVSDDEREWFRHEQNLDLFREFSWHWIGGSWTVSITHDDFNHRAATEFKHALSALRKHHSDEQTAVKAVEDLALKIEKAEKRLTVLRDKMKKLQQQCAHCVTVREHISTYYEASGYDDASTTDRTETTCAICGANLPST